MVGSRFNVGSLQEGVASTGLALNLLSTVTHSPVNCSVCYGYRGEVKD